MERPTTVRAGLGAYIAALVLSAVSQVVSLLNYDRVVEWTYANLGIEPDADLEAALAGAKGSVVTGIVIGFVFIALYALFLWFAWKGHNWARIVLWVLAGLGILGGLFGLALGSPLPFLSALNVFQLLILVAGVVLLALKPSSEWYRYRGWLRAAGQR